MWPNIFPQARISSAAAICKVKFFQESIYILSWGRRIFPPSLVAAQYLGSRLDYSPPSTISPVMRQRDYQLLRFPHCNINIGLSSQFSSSRFCPGLSIIWLGLQRDYPSCARFICATFHYPFLIILPLSFSSPQPLIIPVFSTFTKSLFHHCHAQSNHHYLFLLSSDFPFLPNSLIFFPFTMNHALT